MSSSMYVNLYLYPHFLLYCPTRQLLYPNGVRSSQLRHSTSQGTSYQGDGLKTEKTKKTYTTTQAPKHAANSAHFPITGRG